MMAGGSRLTMMVDRMISRDLSPPVLSGVGVEGKNGLG